LFVKEKDTGMNEPCGSPTPPGPEEIEKVEVRAYFNEARGGTCVEVGANEPVAPTSQSLHLEERLDWSCLLVEPIPELAAKARALRPRATVCECACTRPDRTGEVDLYIPVLPSGDIFGHASMQRNPDDFHYSAHRTIRVQADTLSHLLEKHGVERIDLLSLDVEGAELEVLRGLDFERWRPRLILMEDKCVFLSKHLFLKQKGYVLVRKLNSNSWYVPRGAERPPWPLGERLRLFHRMYLGIWPRKVRYAIRKRDWGPLKSL
jgi:FkbM family methyltransferase